MNVDIFLRELFEAGRFKTSLNLMDRKIYIQIGNEELPIESIEVNYVGDICISIDESLLEKEETA